MRLDLEPVDYKPSALAIELYSSKTVAVQEPSLCSCCIASLYIYHVSTLVDLSSKKYSGSLETETPATS